MKVLVATGLYPPEIGGPATYAKLFEAELPKRGIEVMVLPFRSVRHLPPVIRHLAYLMKTYSRARTSDLVLVQDTVSTGFPAALAAILARRPYILRVPGDYAWEQGVQRFGVHEDLDAFQARTYGISIGIMRALQRFVVRRAARVITPSRYLARIVYDWVPGRHIDVVYNGIEHVDAEPQQKPEGFTIVSIGRLVPWKGMDGIIEVVAREARWNAIIIGDGPERAKLENLARELGCEARVRFMGSLPRNTALGWAKVGDVFVLNSRYEGLSHTLLEVMSLDIPAIAWAVGGNPELIEDAPSLPDEAAVEALHGRIHGVFMGRESARERAEILGRFARTFSIEKTVDGTAKIMSDVAKRAAK